MRSISKSNLVIASIILASVALSCTFIKDKFSKDSFSRVSVENLADVPTFDAKEPLFSPGAAIVRKLAEIDPGLSRFAPAIEANEREALKRAVEERTLTADSVAPERSALSAARDAEVSPMFAMLGAAGSLPPAAAMLMFQGGSASAFIVRDPALAGGMIAGLKNIFSESHTDAKNTSGGVKSRNVTTKDGVTTTFGGELTFRPDGSSMFGIEVKTESVQNGVSVTTEMTGSIDGNECPNADGQVQLTIKLRLAGESGGAQIAQDLTVFVRATVDDDANLAASTMDITQGTRKSKNGRQMYVETGITVTEDYADGHGGTLKGSNDREIRSSQNVHESMDNLNEASTLAQDGVNAAYKAAKTILLIAEGKWQSGQCVQIVADSPGTVAVSSTTSIPVNVIHKFEKGDVPSKLEAVLSGEASIDPQLIPRTAGTLNYVAPGETGKSATISLTAKSKRGKATLDLTANTGGASYQIVGGLDDWKTNSQVCDIMKPFQLKGTFGIVMDVSGGLSGSYSYKGQFQTHGTGTYTITLPNGLGKPGTMVGTGPGSAMGSTRGGTENYTLTPIPPCS